MGKNKDPIPIKSAKTLLEKAGAKRVSKDAAIELKEYLEDLTKKISTKAKTIANHSKRKTIQKKDIRLATKDQF